MTEQMKSALIDMVDYYWCLSEEHELNAQQREQLTEARDSLACGGETEQEWAKNADEILTN